MLCMNCGFNSYYYSQEPSNSFSKYVELDAFDLKASDDFQMVSDFFFRLFFHYEAITRVDCIGISLSYRSIQCTFFFWDVQFNKVL